MPHKIIICKKKNGLSVLHPEQLLCVAVRLLVGLENLLDEKLYTSNGRPIKGDSENVP